jgi:L-fuculose-phosphate aldolase
VTDHADDRAAIVAAYRELDRLGFVTGSAGNLSVRTPAGMLITPTGVGAPALSPAQVVPVTLDGSVTGDWAPSSEWQLHGEIYRLVEGAGAIVHTHADACVALACLGEPLPAFHYTVAAFGADAVPLVPYYTFGSLELAKATGATLRDCSACLLANHGMVVRGRTMAAAVAAAIRLETLARQYLLARSAGTVKLLTPEQMADARARFATYGKQPGRPAGH